MFRTIKKLRTDVEYWNDKFTELWCSIDKLHREIHALKQIIHGEDLLLPIGERGLEEKVHDIATRQRALEEYLRVRVQEEPAMPAIVKMVPWPEPKEDDDADRTSG